MAPDAEREPQLAEASYVYGVVRRDAVPTGIAPGVADAAVRVVERGRLAALVSSLPGGERRLRRRDLQQHLSVLEQAFASGAVVAFRFGTVVADDDAVRRDVLDARRDELAATLARLEGRSQLNVRIVYDEAAVVARIVAERPEIARLNDEARRLGDAGHFARIRVGELVAEALAARRALDARRVLARLEAAAEEVVIEPADELTPLKASFLVADEERFERELEATAADEGPLMRVQAIGPLPPTAFAAAGEV